MNRKETLEVITGPMFSGKTLELWRVVDRFQIADIKVQVFNHSLDARYGEAGEIRSHAGISIPAIKVKNALELLNQVEKDTQVVAIDEIQFFQEKDENGRFLIEGVIDYLLSQGKHVVVSGLDTDFRGEPFGPMPALLAKAEEVSKLKAVCAICKAFNASKTQRLIDGKPAVYDSPVILVGGKDHYEARCQRHHEVPGKPIFKK